MQCAHPFFIKLGEVDERIIPCGKCILCKKMKALDWTVRLKHEYSTSDGKAVFITLTYNDLNIPIGKGLKPILRERDVQLFLKRFRKSFAYRTIRYFYCGEYGKIGNRPHYHMIIFGLDPVIFRPYVLRYKDGKPVYGSLLLNDYWSLGEIVLGTVTSKSIAYTTGYVVDKILDRREHEVKPFLRCSKGLGFDYASKHSDSLKRDKFIRVDGKKVSIPRYYVKKLDIDMHDETVKLLYEKDLKDSIIRDKLHLDFHDLVELASKDREQRERNAKAKQDISSKSL